MRLKTISYVTAILIGFSAAGPGLADTWNVDPDKSKLGFEVKQGKGTLTGSFATWTADIEFDPQRLEEARISAQINPASASTGNPQFDSTMPSTEWFDVNEFPDAEFKTDSVKLIEGNSYKADGTLTIKGISQPVTLDFILEIDGDTAKATGTAKIDRLDYKLGAGVGTDTVGDDVTVTLDLTAIR